MIMHSIIAANNVIKYNEKLSNLIDKVCNVIEKEACEEKYSASVTVDSEDYNVINDVATFLKDELGYKVVVVNHNVLHVSWQEQAIKRVQRDDYLTAVAAFTIASDFGKSYENICEKINKCIEDYSKIGKNHCIYNVDNLCSAIIEEVEETLSDAGYDVVFNGNSLIIKWIE